MEVKKKNTKNISSVILSDPGTRTSVQKHMLITGMKREQFD